MNLKKYSFMLLIICISSNAWAKSPLVNAIENGDYRSFMKLVNNAVIKNGYDGASDCPLITYAAMGKDIRIAKYLLEHGANPNERTNRCVYGGTAISFIRNFPLAPDFKWKPLGQPFDFT